MTFADFADRFLREYLPGRNLGLEAAGLVERGTCPSDLRVAYAQLTDAGRERLHAASCGHVGSVRGLFEEHLSEDELETLAELLEKLPGA